MSPSFTQLVSVALALAGSTLASPTLFAARASPSDIDSYLSAHNTVREAHGAADLVWNDTLATAAQNWANGCVFEHSGGSLGPYGENLAAGTGDFPIASAVGAWAAESTQYDASNPQPSHFTQMVWKGNELRPKVVCFVGKKIWDTYESVAKKTAQPVLGHPAERNAGTHTKREIDHADPLGEGADRLESGTTPDIKLEEEPFTASSETAPRGLTPLRPSVALTSGGSPAQSAAGSPAQSAADDEVKPSLPVTPRDLPKRLPSTSRGSRSTVHEPIDWHTPRKIRLPHDDDAGLVTSYTYFWVTPSTSGLERTPLPDLVAVFASLRAFVETLKAGEGEQGEQGEWLDMDVPAMQRSVDAMKLAAANRARRKAG